MEGIFVVFCACPWLFFEFISCDNCLLFCFQLLQAGGPGGLGGSIPPCVQCLPAVVVDSRGVSVIVTYHQPCPLVDCSP